MRIELVGEMQKASVNIREDRMKGMVIRRYPVLKLSVTVVGGDPYAEHARLMRLAGQEVQVLIVGEAALSGVLPGQVKLPVEGLDLRCEQCGTAHQGAHGLKVGDECPECGQGVMVEHEPAEALKRDMRAGKTQIEIDGHEIAPEQLEEKIGEVVERATRRGRKRSGE